MFVIDVTGKGCEGLVADRFIYGIKIKLMGITGTELLNSLKKLYPNQFSNGFRLLLFPCKKEETILRIDELSVLLRTSCVITYKIEDISEVNSLKNDLIELGVHVAYEESQTNPYYNQLLIFLLSNK